MHPHVGPGTGPIHWYKKDNSAIQAIIQTSGLNAVNTWRKAGKQASTFFTHRGEGSQIDYILLRNPCNLSRINACALPHSPLVHPTGFRHIPVQCNIPWPTIPRQAPVATLTAASVRRACAKQPAVLERFRQEVADLSCPAAELDQQLMDKWQQCQRTAVKLPIIQPPVQEISLKLYWESKRHLRTLAETSLPPCILPGRALFLLQRQGNLTCTGQFMQAILARWRAAAVFQRQNIALRNRTRNRKREKVESQIAEAVEADNKGLTYLYKCMNTLRPKQPKRSIHITGPEGRLQSDQAELTSVCNYFQQVFSSNAPKIRTTWCLQSPLTFSIEEIRSALRRLSAKKALPAGQAPALLWQVGETGIATILHRDWADRFQPGPLEFPAAWHETHTVLIPKPGKPPNTPSNLRPISLLPAIPKMLARVAADRLKPFLEEAAFNMPQFAYLTKRQTLDAIDRVAAHCVNIRVRVAENRYHPFRTRARAAFTGGMQLSLDMAKAFDRMPRALLLRSLERIHAPEDLIILIMFTHENACMKFQRNQHSQVITTGSGIRQGCGLAPLLWAAYSLLLFSTLLRYLHVDQLTGFADDLHMHWSFDQPRQFKNACAQVGFILRDLRQAGMQVSSDKTVILLALSGQSHGPEIKPFFRKTKSGRCLKVHDGLHEVLLPIKQQHSYLGVIISYQHFERATMKHRLHLSWQAFHRLRTFLCTKKLELGQRLRLWRACVLSIATYGLTSIGLHEASASKLRSHVYKQLRIITGNPAHLTSSTTLSLGSCPGVVSEGSTQSRAV